MSTQPVWVNFPFAIITVAKRYKEKLMGLVAFLVVIQSLILLVHWVVFRSMAHYLEFIGDGERLLGWFFVLMSFTFLASNIATRFLPGRLTRTAYFLAALSLGTVYFLFLGVVVVAFLQISSDYLVQAMPGWVAPLVYALSFLWSLWSLTRLKEIRTRSLLLQLPQLPPKWQGKKIAFFADTHYGNIHREKAAERLVAKLKEISPDLILMGGDFFDGPPIDPDSVTAPYRELTQQIPTYFVSGNHEEYGKKAEFLRSLEKNGFRIINDQKIVLDGLQIVGLDFMTTRTSAATEMTLKHLNVDRELPTIVLKHIPRHVKEIAATGADLMLSGHTHQGQVWPANLITAIIYQGYSFGWKKYKQLHVYTTSGAGSWGPPQRLGTHAEVVVFTLT